MSRGFAGLRCNITVQLQLITIHILAISVCWKIRYYDLGIDPAVWREHLLSFSIVQYPLISPVRCTLMT